MSTERFYIQDGKGRLWYNGDANREEGDANYCPPQWVDKASGASSYLSREEAGVEAFKIRGYVRTAAEIGLQGCDFLVTDGQGRFWYSTDEGDGPNGGFSPGWHEADAWKNREVAQTFAVKVGGHVVTRAEVETVKKPEPKKPTNREKRVGVLEQRTAHISGIERKLSTMLEMLAKNRGHYAIIDAGKQCGDVAEIAADEFYNRVGEALPMLVKALGALRIIHSKAVEQLGRVTAMTDDEFDS